MLRVKLDGESEPSIGCQRGARDVAGLVRAEEDYSLGDLIRTACAPGMNTWYQNLVIQVVADDAAQPVMHRRIDESRTNEVDPDSLRRQLRGNARSQPDLSVLRGHVRRAGGEAEKGVDGTDVDDRAAM